MTPVGREDCAGRRADPARKGGDHLLQSQAMETTRGSLQPRPEMLMAY